MTTHRVPLHHYRHTCPTSRDALTVDVWAVVHPDHSIAGVNAHIGVGPGAGPHITPNPDTVYAWGWALLTVGGIMRRTLHLPTLARAPQLDPQHVQIPGQLTIADALEVRHA
jgi:hypothetical protein